MNLKEMEEQLLKESLIYKEKRDEQEKTVNDLKIKLGSERIENRKILVLYDEMQSKMSNVEVQLKLKSQECDEVSKELAQVKKLLSKKDIEQSMLNSSLDKFEKDLEKVSIEAAKYKSFLSLQNDTISELRSQSRNFSRDD